MIAFDFGPKFSLGQVVITANASQAVSREEAGAALRRHARGDWGNLDNEDWAANQTALTDGSRLISVYETTAGIKFYVITEADRSVTTILLPEDY